MKALPSPHEPSFPLLDPETYHDARTIAPGYDVYYLEKQWQSFWYESGQPELKNPDAAFLGFCRSRHARIAEVVADARDVFVPTAVAEIAAPGDSRMMAAG